MFDMTKKIGQKMKMENVMEKYKMKLSGKLQ